MVSKGENCTKKKKIKYINFDGELEGTDIRLKIDDVRINGIEMRSVNVVTEDSDYLLSMKDASLENMALAVTNRKTKMTDYYYVILKPVAFEIKK